MSLSRPRVIQTDEPYIKEKYWVGYDVERIRLTRQSKYSKDMPVFISVIEVEESDYKYNSWDLDEPETH